MWVRLYCRLLSVLTCASWAVVWSGGRVWGEPPSLDSFEVFSTIQEMGTTGALVQASDPDGDTLTYTWTFKEDPTGQAIFFDPLNLEFSEMLAGPHWSFVTFGVGEHGGEGPDEPTTGVEGAQIIVQVDISDGTSTITGMADVLVTGFNERPVIKIDTDGMGTSGNPQLYPAAVGLSALESFDPDGVDGRDLPWLWQITSVRGGRTCSGLPGFTLFLGATAQPVMSFLPVTATRLDPMTVDFTYELYNGLYFLTGTRTGYFASPNGCEGSSGNVPPQVSIEASTLHAAPGETVNLTGMVNDPDDTTHTYSWTQVAGTPMDIALSNPTGKDTSFTAPNVNTLLEFRFTATDSAQQSDSKEIEIRVSVQGGEESGTSEGTVDGPGTCGEVGGNQPAIATVPATYTISEGFQGQIQATSAADPDLTPWIQPPVGGATPLDPGAYFEWSVLDGNVALSGMTTDTVTFVAPAVNADTTFGLQLFVKDAVKCGTKYPIDLVVRDTAGNSKPNVVLEYAVQAQNLEGEASTTPVEVVVSTAAQLEVMLDASKSNDPDPEDKQSSLNFDWEADDNVSQGLVTLIDNNSTAKLTVGAGTLGSVTVQVTVSDDRGKEDSKSQTFVFKDSSDPPPTAMAKVTNGDVEVSGPFGNGEEIYLDGSASTIPGGKQEDIDDLVFEWTQLEGTEVFTKDLDQVKAKVRITDIKRETEEKTLKFQLVVWNGTTPSELPAEVTFDVEPRNVDDGSQGSSEITYPIWAVGSMLQTTFIIDNLAEEAVDDVRIEFYDTEGDLVDDLHYVDVFDPEDSPKPWDHGRGENEEPFTIAGLSSRVIEFVAPPGPAPAGTPEVSNGWALVTSTGLLRGSTRFQLINGEDGSSLQDVGIPNSRPGRKFLTAYRKKDQFALAIANPTDEPIVVTVRLFDLNDPDILVDGDFVSVPPKSQVAEFLDELIQTDIEEGHLIIESEGGEDFALTGLITMDGFFISAQSISRIE